MVFIKTQYCFNNYFPCHVFKLRVFFVYLKEEMQDSFIRKYYKIYLEAIAKWDYKYLNIENFLSQEYYRYEIIFRFGIFRFGVIFR